MPVVPAKTPRSRCSKAEVFCAFAVKNIEHNTAMERIVFFIMDRLIFSVIFNNFGKVKEINIKKALKENKFQNNGQRTE